MKSGLKEKPCLLTYDPNGVHTKIAEQVLGRIPTG